MSSWMLTAGGAEYHLCGHGRLHNDFDLTTIAHALAQINRFTGHASRPYSVAEHSLLCADIAERMNLSPAVQMAALMHDAHEAFTGDVSSPAKEGIGPAWELFEDGHCRDLRRHFGLTATFVGARPQIRQCDLVALASERRDLTAWAESTHAPWAILDTPGRVVPAADWVDLNSLRRTQTHWSEWREQFLQRYHAIKGAQAEWFTANVRAHTGVTHNGYPEAT